MGTTSNYYGKPYGYRGLTGTCRWCGDELRYRRVMADDSDRANPTYRAERHGGWATVRAELPGGYQDGKFCSLRCGYQWAIRNIGGA